jgi:hypothetical protein
MAEWEIKSEGILKIGFGLERRYDYGYVTNITFRKE